MNYRYPPRPNIDRKAQDEIMRKAIEKISNISHTTPKAPTEWEEKHKANRKIGDEIMARIKAKSNADHKEKMIGNGINRLKNSKNTNGVLLLTAALSLLAGAGDDASLINLAKRIAYTGLTGR